MSSSGTGGAGIDVMACFQCGRCSSGCPMSPDLDLLPMEIVRLAGWGLEETIERSRSIWLCTACETCVTRCPNSIDIPRLLDGLRERSIASGLRPAERRVAAFHRSFLRSVRRWGRTWEMGMIGGYKLRSGDLLGDMGLGMLMLARGRLALLPRSIDDRDEIRSIFGSVKHRRPPAGTTRGKP